MLDPKDVTLTDQAGADHLYRLGKIPYLPSREILSQFFTTATPKIGDYQANEKLTIKMFGYIAALTSEGSEIPLKTTELINNHVPDFVTGVKLEGAMLEHNMGFSVVGKIQQYQREWMGNIPESITKILTLLRAALQPPDSAPITNSKPSTASKKR